MTPEETKIGNELAVVDWSDGGAVHNWRNHVPQEVQNIWGTFTSQQRIALWELAHNLANREEWE